MYRDITRTSSYDESNGNTTADDDMNGNITADDESKNTTTDSDHYHTTKTDEPIIQNTRQIAGKTVPSKTYIQTRKEAVNSGRSNVESNDTAFSTSEERSQTSEDDSLQVKNTEHQMSSKNSYNLLNSRSQSFDNSADYTNYNLINEHIIHFGRNDALNMGDGYRDVFSIDPSLKVDPKTKISESLVIEDEKNIETIRMIEREISEFNDKFGNINPDELKIKVERKRRDVEMLAKEYEILESNNKAELEEYNELNDTIDSLEKQLQFLKELDTNLHRFLEENNIHGLDISLSESEKAGVKEHLNFIFDMIEDECKPIDKNLINELKVLTQEKNKLSIELANLRQLSDKIVYNSPDDDLSLINDYLSKFCPDTEIEGDIDEYSFSSLFDSFNLDKPVALLESQEVKDVHYSAINPISYDDFIKSEYNGQYDFISRVSNLLSNIDDKYTEAPMDEPIIDNFSKLKPVEVPEIEEYNPDPNQFKKDIISFYKEIENQLNNRKTLESEFASLEEQLDQIISEPEEPEPLIVKENVISPVLANLEERLKMVNESSKILSDLSQKTKDVSKSTFLNTGKSVELKTFISEPVSSIDNTGWDKFVKSYERLFKFNLEAESKDSKVAPSDNSVNIPYETPNKEIPDDIEQYQKKLQAIATTLNSISYPKEENHITVKEFNYQSPKERFNDDIIMDIFDKYLSADYINNSVYEQSIKDKVSLIEKEKIKHSLLLNEIQKKLDEEKTISKEIEQIKKKGKNIDTLEKEIKKYRKELEIPSSVQVRDIPNYIAKKKN